MTIDDFTKSYYPREKLNKMALENFIDEVLGNIYRNTIANALTRAGIKSIADLYEAKEDQIKAIRHVGNVRFNQIMELKKVINQFVTEGE